MLRLWYWQVRRCTTNFIPRKGIARPQSKFPHSCVCERSIDYPSFGPLIFHQQNRQTDQRKHIHVNHSQKHECRNWDWSRAVPFPGIFVSNFRYCVFAVWGLNPGMLRLSFWQSDAVTTRLYLIHLAISHPLCYVLSTWLYLIHLAISHSQCYCISSSKHWLSGKTLSNQCLPVANLNIEKLFCKRKKNSPTQINRAALQIKLMSNVCI